MKRAGRQDQAGIWERSRPHPGKRGLFVSRAHPGGFDGTVMNRQHANSCGIAVISLDFSAVLSCPSVRPCSLAKALT
ncbi:MAG: hypothetical protein ABIR56_00685, partial [Polaromonas sp.]